MTNFRPLTCRSKSAIGGPYLAHVKYFVALMAALALAGSSLAYADEAEDAYLNILSVVQQADSLVTSGQTNQAIKKYEQAQKSFLDFRKNHFHWNPGMVAFRLSYVTEKIAALAEPPKAATETSETGTEARKSGGSNGVKLLEAGAEPRTVLRFHPSAGAKQAFEMSIKMTMQTKLGETPTPGVELPPINIGGEVEIKGVSPKGEIVYTMVLEEPSVTEENGVKPELASILKSSLAGLKGLTTSVTMSDRGITRKADTRLPASADPQVRQTMEQMKEALANCLAPLPEEAVGPGAKWERKSTLKTQGMSINQTASYELVSVENDEIKTKVSLAQRAANQKIQNPAMPNLKLDLTKLTGKGSGTSTLELDKLMPLAADFQTDTETLMSMNMGGQKQNMSAKMTATLKIQGK